MDVPTPTVTELFAFVTDTQSGEKVVAGRIASNLFFHLIAAGGDPDVLRRFTQFAQQCADDTGRPVRLIRSTGIEVVDTIMPAPKTNPEGES